MTTKNTIPRRYFGTVSDFVFRAKLHITASKQIISGDDPDALITMSMHEGALTYQQDLTPAQARDLAEKLISAADYVDPQNAGQFEFMHEVTA
jgi:hypothetical protein